jgi:hypothetical protein
MGQRSVIPIVATSIYVPLGAAINMSTPTPASANLPAISRQAVLSVVNSFLSASVPCALGSSRSVRAPGPQVGSVLMAPMILPPVACKAESAALRAGKRAVSWALTREKILGIWSKREVITCLCRVSR